MKDLLKAILTDKTARNEEAAKAVLAAETRNLTPWQGAPEM